MAGTPESKRGWLVLINSQLCSKLSEIESVCVSAPASGLVGVSPVSSFHFSVSVSRALWVDFDLSVQF